LAIRLGPAFFTGLMSPACGQKSPASCDPERRTPVDERGPTNPSHDPPGRQSAAPTLGRVEEQHRLLMECVTDYAIFYLEPHGQVPTWNAVAERIFGYQESEIVGQHFSRFFTPEDVQAGQPADRRRNGPGQRVVIDRDNAGERRSTDTISGGETFLTSLSLALELSAQVQRAVGAIHLDCLFIDEGFGTLDPEALRVVADAVRSLQVGGRMVGIVTHIPELREEFDQRLVVAKNGGTSLVRVEVV
jgi:PAS domain S-box-containing protein